MPSKPLNLRLELLEEDPALRNLNDKVQAWWTRFLAKDRPCWLTLCGSGGVGKTHCAKALWKEADQIGRLDKFDDFIPEFIWWPGFINQLRAGKAYEKMADSAHWPLLVVDEIGASRDSTGYVADQLYVILAQRENKWTIITTNLTVEQLRAMDARIASRCVRNGGIVVETNTIDYAHRNLRP